MRQCAVVMYQYASVCSSDVYRVRMYVCLQVPQFRRLIVTNTGMRPVLVSFIPKLDEESYCKPWIEAKPSSAVVQPRK